MTQANSKPTIFQILGAVESGSSLFDDMSDEDLKGIHPYVLTRWLAGSNNAAMVLYINQVANVHNNGLHKHKRLLLRLLQTTRGSGIKAKWIAPPAKTKRETSAVKVIQESLGCSKREAATYLGSVSSQTIIEEAERLGWQKDELKKLKQELA